AAVKKGGRIWLGHSTLARSVRSYRRAIDIWRMVARTAYVQLRFSLVLLVLTTLGLGVAFIVPPLAVFLADGTARWLGAASWFAMAASFVPTLRRYGQSPL